MNHDNQSVDGPPAGELFSRLYIERGAPTQDSGLFRSRLDGYISSNHYSDYSDMATFLKREAGYEISSSYIEKYHSVYYNYTRFFTESTVSQLLDSITLIWRFLREKYRKPTFSTTREVEYTYEKADKWHSFVSRALQEENLAYVLDDMCGVHYYIDGEFELNRISALRCLDVPRYTGVRNEFESAHRYLEATPPDQ